MKLSIEQATLDELTDVISGGVITIETLPETATDQLKSGNSDKAFGVGTLTLPDLVFKGSFD